MINIILHWIEKVEKKIKFNKYKLTNKEKWVDLGDYYITTTSRHLYWKRNDGEYFEHFMGDETHHYIRINGGLIDGILIHSNRNNFRKKTTFVFDKVVDDGLFDR